MIKMAYNLYEDNTPVTTKTEIKITDPDASLSQIFAGFVELTRIAEYQSGSWQTLIKRLYDYYSKYPHFDIYTWAWDEMRESNVF